MWFYPEKNVKSSSADCFCKYQSQSVCVVLECQVNWPQRPKGHLSKETPSVSNKHRCRATSKVEFSHLVYIISIIAAAQRTETLGERSSRRTFYCSAKAIAEHELWLRGKQKWFEAVGGDVMWHKRLSLSLVISEWTKYLNARRTAWKRKPLIQKKHKILFLFILFGCLFSDILSLHIASKQHCGMYCIKTFFKNSPQAFILRLADTCSLFSVLEQKD